ncbi:MAG: Na+/H+ antiporter NhaA [Alphaproteobacteria bacterium]|nr:Na+/H+ antiporter NhaA [Alphaproteobacteria bacterium]
MAKVIAKIQEFLRLESAAGLILMMTAALALVVMNSPLSGFYGDFFALPVAIQLGGFSIDKPLLLWINDGLMAVFFLLVGLEIKRELLEGELSSMSKASLPLVAAIGGMAGPVLIFLYFNTGNADTIDGWAIPAATDIAFALGVLLLLGNRVPATLKTLLLAVAIIDDLGAISIIAIFYTDNLALVPLGLAGVTLAAMLALNLAGVRKLWPYLLLGALLWVFVLKSSVHATLAGVATAAMIPLRRDESGHSPLHDLEHSIHPFVAFFVLPFFAFANSGINLAGLTWEVLMGPLTVGIAAGLFFGKQIGVFGMTYLAAKVGLVKKPDSATWMQVYGIACLTGIGFTMSLFIGSLAFDSPAVMDQVRAGVLGGSIASALAGVAVLILASPKASQPRFDTMEEGKA